MGYANSRGFITGGGVQIECLPFEDALIDAPRTVAFLDPPYAYDTGGMRRTHLKKHRNILKRLLIHTAGFNLSLILRTLLGFGAARGLQGLAWRFVHGLFELWRHWIGVSARRRTWMMQEWWTRSIARSAA